MTTHTFTTGEKVSVIESYSRYHVLQAKKGSTGIILDTAEIHEYENGLPIVVDGYKVQLKSNIVNIPSKYLAPYQKKTKETIQSLSNEELVERYSILSAHEVQSRFGTKAHQKMLTDLQKMKEEILKRMN